jgi:hypothetical protein
MQPTHAVLGCASAPHTCSVAKYRQIKTDNPKIQDKVLALNGAEGVLRAAGFHREG